MAAILYTNVRRGKQIPCTVYHDKILFKGFSIRALIRTLFAIHIFVIRIILIPSVSHDGMFQKTFHKSNILHFV